MNIALLNVKIQIQKNEVVVDKIGNRKSEWKDYYSCYATISEESGKEESTDVGVVDSSVINFTIRYCKVVSQITSTEYRVLFENELYNVKAINHMNYKKKCIKLKCEKVRR